MNLKLLALLLMSSLLVVSCGGDNDDDNDDPILVNTPQNEEDNGTDTNRIIRYNTIELSTDDAGNEAQNVRMDLNRRPVILAGSFTSQDEPAKNCNYQITLTEAQADKLEARADKLRTCSRNVETEEDVAIDGGSYITLTETNGTVTEADKDDIGSDFGVDWTWVCKGKAPFYSYVATLIRSEMPENCPAQAARF